MPGMLEAVESEGDRLTLNGLAFRDDNQVTCLAASVWRGGLYEPGVNVTVEAV